MKMKLTLVPDKPKDKDGGSCGNRKGKAMSTELNRLLTVLNDLGIIHTKVDEPLDPRVSKIVVGSTTLSFVDGEFVEQTEKYD